MDYKNNVLACQYFTHVQYKSQRTVQSGVGFPTLLTDSCIEVKMKAMEMTSVHCADTPENQR